MKRIGFLLLFNLFSVSCLAAIAEKKFVIIITSYNNRDWCKENLNSVFMQEYSNYRVIFVDDHSTDGTPELVERLVKEMGQEYRTIIIKNKTRVRATTNLYNAVQLCDDDEIVFNFDGDDWFAHPQVFSMINEIYQDPTIWITYGQFQNWPTGEMGYCKPVPDEVVEKKWFRRKWWKPGQLRTFYAWLFKQVKLNDLLFEGTGYHGIFFPANVDIAVYYPMMEMTGTRFKFIPDVIYIRNVKTPLNDFKVNQEIQVMGSKQIRGKPVYPTLPHSLSGSFDVYKKSVADIVIFSTNGIKTRRLIESCQELVSHRGVLWVLYEPTATHRSEYKELQKEYAVNCVEINNEHSIAGRLLDCLSVNAASHTLLLHDGLAFIKCVDLRTCIETLERTFAYGFYLNMHADAYYSIHDGRAQAIVPLNTLNNGIDAWWFKGVDEGDWKLVHTFYGALYRSDTVRDYFKNMQSATTFEEAFEYLKKFPIPEQEVGLCYHQQCMVTIS